MSRIVRSTCTFDSWSITEEEEEIFPGLRGLYRPILKAERRRILLPVSWKPRPMFDQLVTAATPWILLPMWAPVNILGLRCICRMRGFPENSTGSGRVPFRGGTLMSTVRDRSRN